MLFYDTTKYLTQKNAFLNGNYTPPQDVVLAVIAQGTVFAALAFLLRNGENTLIVAVGVALYLARYG